MMSASLDQMREPFGFNYIERRVPFWGGIFGLWVGNDMTAPMKIMSERFEAGAFVILMWKEIEDGLKTRRATRATHSAVEEVGAWAGCGRRLRAAVRARALFSAPAHIIAPASRPRLFVCASSRVIEEK